MSHMGIQKRINRRGRRRGTQEQVNGALIYNIYT